MKLSPMFLISRPWNWGKPRNTRNTRQGHQTGGRESNTPETGGSYHRATECIRRKLLSVPLFVYSACSVVKEVLRARLALGRHDERIEVPLPVGGLVHRLDFRPEVNPLFRLGQSDCPAAGTVELQLPFFQRAESPKENSARQGEWWTHASSEQRLGTTRSPCVSPLVLPLCSVCVTIGDALE
jgi:hypothetical protein